jgi:3-deoxy-D-manno-octulosonate 8-phosphate phosphatase (KDO 8-P phosphatase)
MSLSAEAVAERARQVRMLLLDVDGVLTDGAIDIDYTAGESKRFYIRDGAALVWARQEGLEIGLLSGRASGATTRRAEELGIRLVSQGGVDKGTEYRRILEAHSLVDAQVAYMGDDLLDLPVLVRAGLAGAPADAAPEVLTRVHWVSASPGGRGAVREFVELILRARNRWDSLVSEHLT